MKIELQDDCIDEIITQSLDETLSCLDQQLSAAKSSIESGKPYSMAMYYSNDPLADSIKIQELVDAIQKVKEYYQP